MNAKIVCVLLLVFASHYSHAQITRVENSKTEIIGKVGAAGATWISLSKTDDLYVVTYQDVKYQTIDEYKSFAFKDIDNSLAGLYQTILEGFENPPSEDIKLELPEDVIWLHFEKAMGVVSFQFRHSRKNSEVVGYSVYLTKKKLNKLFNKEQ